MYTFIAVICFCVGSFFISRDSVINYRDELETGLMLFGCLVASALWPIAMGLVLLCTPFFMFRLYHAGKR